MKTDGSNIIVDTELGPNVFGWLGHQEDEGPLRAALFSCSIEDELSDGDLNTKNSTTTGFNGQHTSLKGVLRFPPADPSSLTCLGLIVIVIVIIVDSKFNHLLI